MREKDAREILRTKDYQSFTMVNSANCYLEAIEKAKNIVEALKLFENYPCHCSKPFGQPRNPRCDACLARQSLVQWEKTK